MKSKKMRQALVVMLALSFILLAAGSGAWATPLTTQYTVTATVTNEGGGNYEYSYVVTNNNQGGSAPYGYYGLDGFFIQVPLSANILTVNVPTSYGGSPGYWEDVLTSSPNPIISFSGTLKPGYQWLEWWGIDGSSVYPIGATADFSFVVNAPPGLNQGVVTTYLGYPNYECFEGPMTSPVPLPPTVLLLGSGLAGLGLLRFRRKA